MMNVWIALWYLFLILCIYLFIKCRNGPYECDEEDNGPHYRDDYDLIA